MTAAPHGLGESAGVYRLCELFKSNPSLHYRSITIHESGAIQIACDGTTGQLMNWSRAVPEHTHTTALVPTQYGLDEADVIEAAGITVTIRRPLIPGGAS